MLKQAAHWLHCGVARAPAPVPELYLRLVGALSRHVLPRYVSTRLMNSVGEEAIGWPPLKFTSRRVRVGRRTHIQLVPHLGEFDTAALFTKALAYERPTFQWLEDHAAKDYDVVIEIGANVGVFTVFFDALIKQTPAARLQHVVAFEPTLEAYSRLAANLAANDARHVNAFRAAVGKTSGLQSFFEPEGHLTNGSFVREFSSIFSDKITESIVTVVAASELDRYFKTATKALVKIDVEGFEPQLLSAMSSQLETHRPDLLIEVLEGTPEFLEPIAVLQSYDKFIITEKGLQRSDHLYASDVDRDWLLIAKA